MYSKCILKEMRGMSLKNSAYLNIIYIGIVLFIIMLKRIILSGNQNKLIYNNLDLLIDDYKNIELMGYIYIDLGGGYSLVWLKVELIQ